MIDKQNNKPTLGAISFLDFESLPKKLVFENDGLIVDFSSFASKCKQCKADCVLKIKPKPFGAITIYDFYIGCYPCGTFWQGGSIKPFKGDLLFKNIGEDSFIKIKPQKNLELLVDFVTNLLYFTYSRIKQSLTTRKDKRGKHDP